MERQHGARSSDAQLDQPSVSRRLLRWAAKRHRYDAGVWRLGSDGWCLHPSLVDETTLMPPQRFAPLQQWQASRYGPLGSSWASVTWPYRTERCVLWFFVPRRRPSQTCTPPWLALDRPHQRPQRRRNLQLLFGPVGRQGG